MAERRVQGAGKFGTASLQLIAMGHGKFLEEFAPCRGKADPDFTPVFGTRGAEDGAVVLEAVHEFYGAVVLDE